MKTSEARRDYPKGVYRIWDNGGRTFDRYTVIYTHYRLPKEHGSMWSNRKVYPYVGMSKHPFHPQRFGQHGELYDYLHYHLQRLCPDKVIRFAGLPPDCQKLVMWDLAEFERQEREE